MEGLGQINLMINLITYPLSRTHKQGGHVCYVELENKYVVGEPFCPIDLAESLLPARMKCGFLLISFPQISSQL
jgi:hypothetical protein